MKKQIVHIVFLMLVTLTIFSCRPKEVKNLDDFKKKYDIKTVEFKDCNELTTAYSEFMNLYVTKLEKATSVQEFQNDEEANELMSLFQSVFGTQINKFTECKSTIDSIDNSYEERVKGAYGKLMQSGMEMDETNDSISDEYITDDSLETTEDEVPQ